MAYESGPGKEVEILDTTLRDGSYSIGYQFTRAETSFLCAGLEYAGVRYIEIGHGQGLDAAVNSSILQGASDLEYMMAAAEALKQGHFGFFFIPGIGRLDSIKTLKEQGGGFIRVGVEPNNLKEAMDVTEYARDQGIEVWANLMKTNTLSIDECRLFATKLVGAGASGVYVVDSAGGMLPYEAAAYVQTVYDAIKSVEPHARVGFHGHDNLSLSVACALSAIEAGAQIVDGSLLGLGRSVGNAPSELLAMVIKRSGYRSSVDPWILSKLAQDNIRQFMETRWQKDTLTQALGYTQVHSTFLPLVRQMAYDQGVDPLTILLNLGPEAKYHVDESMVQTAIGRSKEVANKSAALLPEMPHFEFQLSKSVPPESTLARYLHDMYSQAQRLGKKAILIVSGPWHSGSLEPLKLSPIRILSNEIIGAIELSTIADILEALKDVDGKINYLLFDKSRKEKMFEDVERQARQTLKQTQVLPYSDLMTVVVGICHLLAVNRILVPLKVIGEQELATIFRLILPYWGIELVEDESTRALLLVEYGDIATLVETNPHVEIIYDIGSGSIDGQDVDMLLDKGIEVRGFDGRGALVSEVLGVITSHELSSKHSGRAVLNDIHVVAGGYWGKCGDIVLDSIEDPQKVLGVANGTGGLLQELDEHSRDQVHRLMQIFYVSKLHRLLEE